LVPDLAYLFIGTAGMTGFTIFASTLLEMVGLHVPQMALFVVCAGSIWYLGYKDIRLSSGLMLVIEGLSVALIPLLCAIVLFGQKSIFDTNQESCRGHHSRESASAWWSPSSVWSDRREPLR
jgi:hypothetical protein